MRYAGYSLLVFALIVGFRGALNAAEEEAAVETKIKTILLDPTTGTPVVILETVGDKKLVPIWIDVPEAKAIAIELQHVQSPRPLTHDLIRNILQSLGATLQRATITDIRNNTYFAALHLRLQNEEFRIDSRPSDAIAVALRMKAPIYMAPQVVLKAKPAPTPDQPAEQLRKKLGIKTQHLTGEFGSVLDIRWLNRVVTDPTLRSPAERAGIQQGPWLPKALKNSFE
jgi:bifunctional DNase/RNase